MFRKLFKNKRTLLAIPVGLGLLVYFFPFLLGAVLVYLVITHIRQTTLKYLLVLLIVTLSLPIGSGWFMGMTRNINSEGQKAQQATPTIIIITVIPTSIPSPTPTPSSLKKRIGVPTPTKAVSIPTVASSKQPVVQPTQQTSTTYACNCSKTCSQLTSCAEAQYQLNVCGCSARDADHDGTACDLAPLYCQK